MDRLIDHILLEEPLISTSRKPQLKKLIESKWACRSLSLSRTYREAAGKLGTEIRAVQGSARPLAAAYKLRVQQEW